MSYDNMFWGGKNRAGVEVPNHSQWKIKAESLLAEVNVFTPHATKRFPLGAIAEARDGRKWRYCQNSSAAILAKALMNVSQVHDTQAITSTAQTAYGTAAGVKRFDVLLTTGHGWTTSALIDGWLLVGDGATAMGDMYLIKDNTVNAALPATVMNVEISDTGGVRTIIAATDDIVLFRNKLKDTIVGPTTQTNGGSPVGVSLADVPVSNFYWAQYSGYTPILVDSSDTIVVGEPCGHPGTNGTAGGVGVVANDGTDSVWGLCVYASTTDEAAIVDLMLP